MKIKTLFLARVDSHDGGEVLGARKSETVGKPSKLSIIEEQIGARRGRWLAGIVALVAAAVLKIWLNMDQTVPFNSDEAIVALMARHIGQGEFPLFFYGQAYMGSLDALLVAGAFRAFGETVTSLRFIQSVLYLGTIGSAVVLSRMVFRNWVAGIATGWLLAIPVVTVSLYTTASLGNYGEVLLLGNLILILSIRIATMYKGDFGPMKWLWLVLGLIMGLGFWAFGLILVYTIPACCYLFFVTYHTFNRSYRVWLRQMLVPGLLGGLGFAIGGLPIWVFIGQQGLPGVIGELGGTAISGVEGLTYGGQVFQHLFSVLLFGVTAVVGLRPSWEIRWLALPLAPLAIIFWGAVVLITAKIARQTANLRSEMLLILGVITTLLLGFTLTPFGADPSGRYFLPAMVMLSILAGGALHYLSTRNGKPVWALLAVVLVFNLWGTLDSARRLPPGITTQFDPVTQIDHHHDQHLIEFLMANNATRGYTNYWVAYPLAFLSQEELLFTPRLPYHQDFRYTTRDNRYSPYHDFVEASDNIAYITTNHPELEDRLRDGFSALNIVWEEETIGDFQIFFALSQTVRPEELGLGTTSR